MDSSLFARLSPEIRNQIYEYTFISPYKLRLAHGETQHALTKTCRQIRRETLAMYYTLTRFNAHLDDRPSFPLTSWLQSIGPESVLLVRELHVWTMHDLSFTVHAHGTRSPELDQQGFGLAPVAADSLSTMRYLRAILSAYKGMGVTLQQYCREVEILIPGRPVQMMSDLCSWFTVTRKILS